VRSLSEAMFLGEDIPDLGSATLEGRLPGVESIINWRTLELNPEHNPSIAQKSWPDR